MVPGLGLRRPCSILLSPLGSRLPCKEAPDRLFNKKTRGKRSHVTKKQGVPAGSQH